MTDQERPVEERNELLDDLLTAANNVAVEEPTESKQQAAVDEQPEQAAQPAEVTQAEDAPAATEPSAEPPVAQASDTAESDDAEVAELSAEPPVAQASDTTESDDAEVAASSVADPIAETPAAQASDTDEPDSAAVPSSTMAESSAETPVAQASNTPELNSDEVPASSVVEPSAETTAAVESGATSLRTLVDPYSAATSEAAAVVAEPEGASYTPVAEAEQAGKPRRVKDLEPGMELEGRVTSIALYGIFVDMGVGRDGLVHISEMSDTRIDSPSDIVQIGDTVKVRVKSVEPDGRRISLTMRSKERASGDQRSRSRKKPELNREALAALRVGDNVEGTVTGIAPFGVFVNIGVGKDGLVHVSELAEGRVEKPEDAVQVGQTYTFKILEVDADGTRISLSLRRAQRGQRLQQLEKGQILEGTVSGLAPFGAFVDINVGRDGLVHISELTEGHVNKVEDAVKVGDKVTVRVLDIDPASKRISLTLRLEDRPREASEPRSELAGEPREERGRREERGPRREERGPRGPRRDRDEEQRAPEVYTSSEEPEEAFTGDATIEDLLSKFGGSKRERKRQQDTDEEDSEDRFTRRQRDAIRRTLQQMGEDE